jgi:hypothetical protein
MILVLLLYASLASTFTLGKMLLSFLPPFLLIGVRMVIAGSLLLGFHYFTTKEKFKISAYDLLLLVGFSFIHIFILLAYSYNTLLLFTKQR